VKLRWRYLAAAVALVLLVLIVPEGESEWSGNVFEQEMDVALTPDHVADRAPFDKEELEIVITSRTGQFINAADVRFTWSYDGKISTEGGYSFTRLNQSSMRGSIPGHPGGYTITYRIVAYDEKNTPLTSTQYSYTVQKNGSFQGSDFEANIEMTWSPTTPKNYENVRIEMKARDPLVIIARADLFYTVSIPGQDSVDGVTYFSGDGPNATWSATLIFYPPGSKVSFHVEAYDTYLDKKIVSDPQYYEYPRIPPAVPIYTGYIFVQFRDVTRDGPPDPKEELEVTFSNLTYVHETVAQAGIAYTNRSVYQGFYLVQAKYLNRTYSWNVSVPKPDGSFSFLFNVNEKTYRVPYAKESRPGYKDAIGALLLLFLVAGSVVLTTRLKDYYLKIAEERKKLRRKGEDEQPLKWYDRILRDEKRKDDAVKVGAFLVLSFSGLIWAPFYPWWMIILLSASLTAVAVKFPYISMLVLAVLVTASTAYQSREFGWVFLMLSLVTMVGGFFDWRYAYLVFLTVFATGFGIGYAVPLAGALLISMMMGVVVLITAGLFLLIIAPSGNFDWFSLIATGGHARSFVTFSRPAPSSWSPVDLARALSSISSVDTETITSVLEDTLTDLSPLLGLLSWALALVLVYLIFIRVEKGEAIISPDVKGWAIRAIPGIVLSFFGIATFVWSSVEFNIFTLFGLLGCLPASILAFTMRGLGQETMPLHYGLVEVKSSDVGVKVSEMVNFRKADFKDIGGLGSVKREVRNSIMVPLLEPDMATKYGVKPTKGILLFGPPGCGKTLMLRAVASDLNVDMIGLKCSDVMSKWYGESENLIASLFEEAKARSPCILFLDEIDAIAKRRDFYSTDDVTPRVLSIMLSEMDGMDAAEGVIIVATTNMPDLVDPALMRPGRFDKVIYVPPPDLEGREEILRIHLKGKFASKDIDVPAIARRTDGFSGADLSNLVTEASTIGLEKALETKKPQPIRTEDIDSVLDEIKPSVSSKTLKMYEKLRKEYERKGKKEDGAASRSANASSSSVEEGDGLKWEE